MPRVRLAAMSSANMDGQVEAMKQLTKLIDGKKNRDFG